MLPSWIFLVLIVLGGAIAVFGTTLYPVARDVENSKRLANQARAILYPELENNGMHAEAMKKLLMSGSLDLNSFDVTAWETIYKGGLLIGLEPSETTSLLRIYSLIYRANSLNDQLIDTVTGVTSALSNGQQIRQGFSSALLNTLEQLSSALSEFKGKKTK